MSAFRVMCPDRMDSKHKIKVSALIPCNTTILTAYNGTHIPIHGMLSVNCQKNNKTPCPPHLLYVAETPRPIILGLPSCQLLGLITLHCAMNVKQPVTITNIEQLMKSYPNSFDTLGQFRHIRHRDPDPIPATEYENPTLPRVPEATCTKSGRISNPP